MGTPATPITEAVIDAAETALFLAKVAPSDPKFIVVDAATYSAWRQIPRFSEFQTAGDAGLYPSLPRKRKRKSTAAQLLEEERGSR